MLQILNQYPKEVEVGDHQGELEEQEVELGRKDKKSSTTSSICSSTPAGFSSPATYCYTTTIKVPANLAPSTLTVDPPSHLPTINLVAEEIPEEEMDDWTIEELEAYTDDMEKRIRKGR